MIHYFVSYFHAENNQASSTWGMGNILVNYPYRVKTLYDIRDMENAVKKSSGYGSAVIINYIELEESNDSQAS